MNPVNVDQRFLGIAGTVTATQEILGPHNFFEYVGSTVGNDLEFSVDGSNFIRMHPGMMLRNLQAAPVAYIRSVSPVAENYVVKYGSVEISEKEGPQRDAYGRHPIGRSYASVAGAPGALRMFPFSSSVQNNPRAWRHHLKDLIASNDGAAAAYIKIARGTGVAPTPGVTVPLVTLAVPATGNLIITTTHGIRGVDQGLSGAAADDLYYWITGLPAVADVTAVAADQVLMLANFC